MKQDRVDVPRDRAGMLHVVVDGKRLETAWWPGDDARRPAIVLLHEGLGSLELWRDFPARLAERTRLQRAGVLALRLRPLGACCERSANRTTCTTRRAWCCPRCSRRWASSGPSLFGHSDGASIALLYAGDPAHDPRGLILEAPHVFVEELSVRSIAAARDAYAATGLRAKLARYHDDVDATFRGWNDIWLDPRFRAWNIEDAANGVRCPVLLVQGDADEYGTTAQLAAIAARVPVSETLHGARRRPQPAPRRPRAGARARGGVRRAARNVANAQCATCAPAARRVESRNLDRSKRCG